MGLVILPFSIANEALDRFWIFGDTWCTMWLTMDIWMCTASIYNLVAISIDRYIAIIKPLNYPMLVTKFRARCIVAAVWVGSFIICSPSFLLASTDTTKPKDCKCTPANSGVAYIVFSASSSFYIPMIVVIFVYVRIYIAACAATKSVYSGMMQVGREKFCKKTCLTQSDFQVTANANKNPKNILMQNPSALSRTENMPMLRVHRGSSIAMKNPSLNAQMDSSRSRYGKFKEESRRRNFLCLTPVKKKIKHFKILGLQPDLLFKMARRLPFIHKQMEAFRVYSMLKIIVGADHHECNPEGTVKKKRIRKVIVQVGNPHVVGAAAVRTEVFATSLMNLYYRRPVISMKGKGVNSSINYQPQANPKHGPVIYLEVISRWNE